MPRAASLLAILLTSAAAAAQGPVHWSLEPVVRPTPPVVADRTWVRSPIDRFVLARLERAGLRPSGPAGRATLSRRLALVMHGLPPSPDALRAFVADEAPDAWRQLTENALASPRYGERWGRHWLDLVRFAETNGFETNTPRGNAWPYRDWVIRAFNDDMPYDRFVTAQLAGDALGDDAATGFLVAGPYDTVKSPAPFFAENQRLDELSDMINVTSTAFLGLTVACARCHDHKFDPISQRDYYAMQAILTGVQHGERPMGTPDQKKIDAEVAQLDRRIERIDKDLAAWPPREARPGDAVLVDDEDLGAAPGVVLLQPPGGHGDNPDGAALGHRADLGDLSRAPNLSSGRYSFWYKPNEDLIAYAPGVEGRHRIWISWGAGYPNHSQGARYLLDRDGDPETTDDQVSLATIDQRRLADGTLEVSKRPLWSGLKDVGVHELSPASTVILRACGASDRGVTADAVLFVKDSTTGHPATALRRPVRGDRNVEHIAPVRAAAIRFTTFATNNGSEPCIDELEAWTPATDVGSTNAALASSGSRATSSGNYGGNPKHRLAHIHDGRYGNPRSWISNARGAGWVQIEFAKPSVIDRVVWGRDRDRRFADRLPSRYVIEARVEGEWRRVASSSDHLPFEIDPERAPAWRLGHLSAADGAAGLQLLNERLALTARAAALRKKPQVYAGRFTKPAPTRLLQRGDPATPGDPVVPDIPAVLGSIGIPADAPDRARREALAAAVTDPRNPLTARVIVNRIWQHHFGEGLVDTPSDFGHMGTTPSHPELLDWLAAELVDNGWSLKHIHRLILGSATWQQAGTPRPDGQRVDADARLLWRFPARRLESEAIRDAILSASGELDLTMGGPGFEIFELNSNYVRNYEPRKVFAADGFRRMVYARVIRMERDATFGAFDAPDAGQLCPKRTRSTTALQCLNLFNSPFVAQRAEAFAKRLRKDAGDDRRAQVVRGFWLAFGRAPDPTELTAGIAIITTHSLDGFCRALLNANEFLQLP